MNNDSVQLRKIADRLTAEHSHAVRRVTEEATAVESAKGKITDAEEAQRIVTELAAGIQNEVHGKIAAVVSKCLTAIFGDDAYQFSISFERKRGRTEARLRFTKGKNEVNPIDAAGGGVVDVAAFALRVACLVLMRPPARRFLVLDEPMRHLNGAEYQKRFGHAILMIAKELNIQIIMATDCEWLRLGKVVELGDSSNE